MPGKPKKSGRFTRNVSPFHLPHFFPVSRESPLKGTRETKRTKRNVRQDDSSEKKFPPSLASIKPDRARTAPPADKGEHRK
jgi:hypothetical protein